MSTVHTDVPSTDVPSTDAKSICVFCGASTTVDPAYIDLATRLGAEIAARGYRLVYGGGGLGLMGAVARGTADAGGEVLGVIPRFLTELEQVVTDVPHVIVESMHERKMIMYDQADAFITLPGGIGTLEECVEVMSWARLKLHAKPIVYLSEDEFYAPMRELLDHIVEKRFAPAWMGEDCAFTQSIGDAFGFIERAWTERAGRVVGQGAFSEADL